MSRHLVRCPRALDKGYDGNIEEEQKVGSSSQVVPAIVISIVNKVVNLVADYGTGIVGRALGHVSYILTEMRVGDAIGT